MKSTKINTSMGKQIQIVFTQASISL